MTQLVDPWPPGLELAEFKPCIFYVEEMRVTQMLLEDAPIVWHAWRGTRHMGHAVDLGYHMETGKLVGIQIWDDVREAPVAQEVEAGA
jgi:hypothetical protein